MRECQADAFDWERTQDDPSPKILGIIPIRLGSSRFPRKVLAEINGMPMVWHVYQRARESQCLDDIVVATPDAEAQDVCQSLQITSILTPLSSRGDCIDCIAEVATRMPAALYVCIQGDEPCVSPDAIRRVKEAGLTEPLPVCGCAAITDPADVVDVTVPKVVLGSGDLAIYLSRSPVPYLRSRSVPYRSQVCVYAFHADDLVWFANTPAGPLEKAESIGLLRFLEHHVPVKMVEVPASPVAVDTPADLERARMILGRATGR